MGELDERILPCLLLMAGSVEHPIMSTACHQLALCNKSHREHVSSLGGWGFQVMLRVVWKDRKDTKVYIQPNLCKGKCTDSKLEGQTSSPV